MLSPNQNGPSPGAGQVWGPDVAQLNRSCGSSWKCWGCAPCSPGALAPGAHPQAYSHAGVAQRGLTVRVHLSMGVSTPERVLSCDDAKRDVKDGDPL